METFTADEIRAALREAIWDAGGAANYARKVGVSRQMVSSLLNGKQDPCGAVLRDLGFKKTFVYEPLPQPPQDGEE